MTDPIGAVTFTAYDALNRATSVMDAREGITRFGFDAVGNQTSLTDAAGNVNRWAFDRLTKSPASPGTAMVTATATGWTIARIPGSNATRCQYER